MRRAAAIGLVLFAAGCFESRIAETERRTQAITLHNQSIERLQIRAIEGAIDRRQRQVDELGHQQAEMASELRDLQERLVAIWHGDPALLEGRLGKSGLPDSLRPFLQAAQARLGSSTKEQQFLHAIEYRAANDLGVALDRWEEKAGFGPSGESSASPAGKKATECTIRKVPTSCRVIPSEETPPIPRALCTRSKSTPPALDSLLSVEDGRLTIRDFPALAPEVKSVVRSFAGGWLARLEFETPVERFRGESLGPTRARSWLGFLHFMDHKIRPELHAEVPEQGPKPVLVDLDGDGSDEVLVLANPPRALHYDSRDGDMKIVSVGEVCALADNLKVPALRQICQPSAAGRRSSAPTSEPRAPN
jgi:hypothetical protein